MAAASLRTASGVQAGPDATATGRPALNARQGRVGPNEIPRAQ